MLPENGLQTLFTEEVATLCLHGIPHGQVALGALMPLEKRVDECATVSWHTAPALKEIEKALLKCRTLGAKWSEQTDSHMLCSYAGGVSTLSLEPPQYINEKTQCSIELLEAEQLCILATVASYTRSRWYAQARKHDAWFNNVHAQFPRSKNDTTGIAVQCRKCWISAKEWFQRKPHNFFDLRCLLSVW